MLQSPTRRLLFLAALLTLALPASASASYVERHAPPAKAEPRIVNGTEVTDNGKYPAQGRLLFDVDPGPGQSVFACGGTLVGSRQFLTAAHCAVDAGEAALPPENFNVFLGEVDRDLHGDANRHFFGAVDVHPGYNADTHQNDLAMLTLDEPVTFEPARVVEDGEQELWDPGTLARVICWGRTIANNPTSSSRFLRETDVPMVSDATCGSDSSYGSEFDPATMVCAGDPPGTAAPRDTCQGDSGGPLYVADFGSTPADPIFATAGVVSWGIGCANPQFPGIYTRIGEGALNDWTLDRTPRASFDLDHAAVATQAVTLFSTSEHPEGPSGFTTFKWDLDQDGQFDDATGASLVQTFPTAGQRVVGIEASKPGADVARFYGAFNVAAAPIVTPPPAGGGGGSTPPPSGGGQTPPPPVVARLATLKSPKSLKARKGRFNVKVSFDATAPAGTATLTVLLKGKKIGSARVKIKPGGTSTAKVKLTKAGVRKLKKAKKLKVSLRITVAGKRTTKALTIRR